MRLPSAVRNVNYSCTANTHCGRHIDVVLPVVQECEYVASGMCYTQSRIISADDQRRSASSCGCGFQDEGRKVEKQCEKVVKHILEKERGEIQWKKGEVGQVIRRNEHFCCSNVAWTLEIWTQQMNFASDTTCYKMAQRVWNARQRQKKTIFINSPEVDRLKWPRHESKQDAPMEKDAEGQAGEEQRLWRVWQDDTRAFVPSRRELIISVAQCWGQNNDGGWRLCGDILL